MTDSPWANIARVITDPAATPDDFTRPELREDFPPINLDTRRARIDAEIEAALQRHPSNADVCGDQGCGRRDPDDCPKCAGAVILPFQRRQA